jgi:predicted Ser/Thr protein kinase
MDTQFLEQCVQEIQVRNVENADVDVVNNSPLVMIGKGRQGAVFQVTDDICVKVFGNLEDCDREYYALSLGQQSDLFPRVYAKGPLHVAMEIIRGVDLREYLQSQPLTKELSIKLIHLLTTFKEIGYERIDHHKRQIFIQEDGKLKVIDVARTVWRDRVYPYPRKLLNSLGKEYKQLFLSHVQALSPELYEEWQHYIQMEALSHQILQQLINETPDEEAAITASKELLTMNDEQNYNNQLENLVHKVFKEEWVKAMLAQGYDLEEVKAKLDEYQLQTPIPEKEKEKEKKLLKAKEEEKKNAPKPKLEFEFESEPESKNESESSYEHYGYYENSRYSRSYNEKDSFLKRDPYSDYRENNRYVDKYKEIDRYYRRGYFSRDIQENKKSQDNKGLNKDSPQKKEKKRRRKKSN